MNNAKRIKKRAIRSLLDSIARSLHRQAVAAERCEELYLRGPASATLWQPEK